MGRTVAEAVGHTLVGLGVEQVFGVVGSGNFHLSNAMTAAGARFVTARHEAGATTMADAYARMSGTVSAVTVHQGCGLTNTMTGMAEAAKSRTPLVLLAADVTERRSNFYVDQDALATAVGAVPMRVDDPADAVRVATEAFRTACEDRRTVLLNLPLHVQARCRSRTWTPSPKRWPRPDGRCSWPDAAPVAPVASSSDLPSGAARCWPPARSPRDSSTASRGRWTCPAGSPRRSRSS